ncbi:MAG TPA: hypothetical protein VGB63_17280 [Pedobacter sp.]|jgi:hypothetical protein
MNKLLLLVAVTFASCGTATSYRNVQIIKTGTIERALLLRSDSKNMIAGDTVQLRKAGPHVWSQNYISYPDTVRFEQGNRQAFAVQYAKAKIVD